MKAEDAKIYVNGFIPDDSHLTHDKLHLTQNNFHLVLGGTTLLAELFLTPQEERKALQKLCQVFMEYACCLVIL